VDFNRRDGPRPPDQEDLHVYFTGRLLAVKPSQRLPVCSDVILRRAIALRGTSRNVYTRNAVEAAPNFPSTSSTHSIRRKLPHGASDAAQDDIRVSATPVSMFPIHS